MPTACYMSKPHKSKGFLDEGWLVAPRCGRRGCRTRCTCSSAGRGRTLLRDASRTGPDTLRIPAAGHATGACGQHRAPYLRVRDVAGIPEHLGAEPQCREVPG